MTYRRPPDPPPPEPTQTDYLIFGEKTCTVCGRVLPADSEQFGRDKNETDGLTHDCRRCRRKASVASYERRGGCEGRLARRAARTAP